MKSEISMQELLRWRLVRAGEAAPPAPRGNQLLAMNRPWWEVLPAQFRALAERVSRIQVAYGHAMSEPARSPAGYPVPTVVLDQGEEIETTVRILYLRASGGRLRLRFELSGVNLASKALEATLVAGEPSQPILSAAAQPSVDHEFSLDAPLPASIGTTWEGIKVTDRMPFRLILRTAGGAG